LELKNAPDGVCRRGLLARKRTIYWTSGSVKPIASGKRFSVKCSVSNAEQEIPTEKWEETLTEHECGGINEAYFRISNFLKQIIGGRNEKV